MDSINIRPNVRMYAALTAVNYSAWHALGEFVDNSIQSFQSNVKQLEDVGFTPPLEIDIDISSNQIIVKDNAAGISEERFSAAFEIGNPPPNINGGLSVYGMGLKSAACWFSQHLEVITTAAKRGITRTVKLDFDEIIENAVEEIPIIETPAPTSKHGTEIKLTRLRQSIPGATSKKVQDHLASMYRDLIRKKLVVITYKGTPLEYKKPKVLKAKYTGNPQEEVRWEKSLNITLETGERIKGFAALRETGYARGRGSGFTLFREGRAIEGILDDPWQPEEIFGVANRFKKQRLFGELHISGVKVAFSKNAMIWPPHIEDEFIKVLKKELDAEPLPLLKQGETYRAKSSEKSQINTAKKALPQVVEAFERATVNDLKKITSEVKIDKKPLKELSTPKEIFSAKVEYSIEVSGQIWQVEVQTVFDKKSTKWLEWTDSSPSKESYDRKITLRFNHAVDFLKNFGPTTLEGWEPIFRIGAALVLAQIATTDFFPDAYVLERTLNNFLAEELGQRRQN